MERDEESGIITTIIDHRETQVVIQKLLEYFFLSRPLNPNELSKRLSGEALKFLDIFCCINNFWSDISSLLFTVLHKC